MRSVTYIARVKLPDGQPVPDEWRRLGWPCAGCGVIPTVTDEAWGYATECARCDIRAFVSIGD